MLKKLELLNMLNRGMEKTFTKDSYKTFRGVNNNVQGEKFIE